MDSDDFIRTVNFWLSESPRPCAVIMSVHGRPFGAVAVVTATQLYAMLCSAPRADRQNLFEACRMLVTAYFDVFACQLSAFVGALLAA